MYNFQVVTGPIKNYYLYFFQKKKKNTFSLTQPQIFFSTSYFNNIFSKYITLPTLVECLLIKDTVYFIRLSNLINLVKYTLLKFLVKSCVRCLEETDK